MKKKLNVAVICGGKSAEHEISLISAKNIFNSLNKDKYNISMIGISKSGSWHQLGPTPNFLNTSDPKKISFQQSDNEIFPTPNGALSPSEPSLNEFTVDQADVVIPALHGPNGEDGSIQGFFQLAEIPIVGCGVLSSAMCMDKDITKKILSTEGIPVARHLLARRSSPDSWPSYKRAQAELGDTLFVKPANMGSSVGVSKVSSEKDYQNALNLAFKYDSKVLIEEGLSARELEVALLGNSKVEASVVGEVAPESGFYSFDAKYIDADGAKLIVPADIPAELSEEIRSMAKLVFETLECQGLARCDFFYTDQGRLLVNEINTFPGFTSISQYPMLWKASGLDYTDLLDKLISLALESK